MVRSMTRRGENECWLPTSAQPTRTTTSLACVEGGSMEFREALEIARTNLGYSVTRNESGNFVVLRPDGTVVGAPEPGETELAIIRRENERLRERYGWACDQPEQSGREHRAEIVRLEARIHELSSALSAERDEHSKCDHELQLIKNKLSKVSKEELDRIKEADAKERDARATELRAERRQVLCPCRGEVENCTRCNGRGTYTADGYGNIV